MRLVSIAAAASLLMASWPTACSGPPTPSSPSPSPEPSASPAPSYPRGVANATAFENLELIRNLERSSGRSSDLVFIGSAAKLDGRISPGGGWRYQFAEGTIRVVEWDVSPAGEVIFIPNAFWSGFRMEKKGIGPSLKLDSPAIIASALENGGQAYVNRFPDALAGILWAYFSGLVYVNVQFYTPETKAPCELGPIVFDARTGDLLTRDLSCLARL